MGTENTMLKRVLVLHRRKAEETVQNSLDFIKFLLLVTPYVFMQNPSQQISIPQNYHSKLLLLFLYAFLNEKNFFHLL